MEAESAAKNCGFEPYRYECAYCWEEVHLCAADSQNQVPHFRHRSGNNNVKCENYLGKRNEVIKTALSRRNIRDKIGFYYSNITKMFSIGIKLSTKEIDSYEQNGVCFQLRSEQSTKPTLTIPIRGSRFLSDAYEFFTISEFAWKYYVSFSNESSPQECQLFRKDSRGSLYPSFFKIQADGDDDTFHAKLVCSDILYTNTQYFMVFPHQYQTIIAQNDVIVRKAFKFRSMNRDFSGYIVTFTNKTAEVEQQLKKWKYRLDEHETLTLLWPPSSLINDSVLINSICTYIYSSFDMLAHCNINVHSRDIVEIGKGISKISINGRTKIYKKNAELILDKFEGITDEYDSLTVIHEVSKNYVSSDNGDYLFNRCGVSPLKKGMSTSLTKESEVRHYSFGYLDRIVTGPNIVNTLVGARLLNDILMHYKRTEVFNWSNYESLNLSPVALQYIETCKKTGMINSTVKRFIEEGRI